MRVHCFQFGRLGYISLDFFPALSWRVVMLGGDASVGFYPFGLGVVLGCVDLNGLLLGGLEAGLGVADAKGYLPTARGVVVGLFGMEVAYPGHFGQVAAVLVDLILVVGIYLVLVHAESCHK